jgi:hypothetical protein
MNLAQHWPLRLYWHEFATILDHQKMKEVMQILV